MCSGWVGTWMNASCMSLSHLHSGAFGSSAVILLFSPTQSYAAPTLSGPSGRGKGEGERRGELRPSRERTLCTAGLHHRPPKKIAEVHTPSLSHKLQRLREMLGFNALDL